MKRSLILLVLLFLAIEVPAQNNIQNIKVTYKHLVTKSDFPKPFEFTIKTVLLFNDSVAQYVYKRPEKKVRAGNYQTRTIAHKYINNYFFKDGLMKEQRILPNGILKAVWKPDYKWNITDETQVIKGYECKKAITKSIEVDPTDESYFGDAIVWFTEEIPVPAGPDRYCGLPGLILKVEYEKSIRTTQVDKIEFNVKDSFKDISEGAEVKDKDDVIFAFFKNPKEVQSALKRAGYKK